MDIKIGVPNISRELTVTVDASAEDVTRQFTQALRDGEMFQLTDTKGGVLVIPASNIAYLDFGSADARQVGFGTV